MTLTVVDTPGFGDAVDNSNWYLLFVFCFFSSFTFCIEKRRRRIGCNLVLTRDFFLFFSWQPIVDYIESKYEEYLNAESRVQRQPMRDNRVHVCLYFIQPSGHGLKPLDIEFMKRLHDKVNIIPVLAKADTMTPDECTYFKKQVRASISCSSDVAVY